MATVTTTKKVKEFINQNPGRTKTELAILLGLKHVTFIYHYQKLLKSGEVQKIEDKIKMNTAQIEKLEKYFWYGFNDKEACFKANVPTSTFYVYCKENPEWAERRQVLKKSPEMRAKELVAKKLKKTEENDDYVKMVYQEEKRQERAKIKVDLEVTKEDEEDIEVKRSVSVNVTFSD